MTKLTYEQLKKDSRFTIAMKPWYGKFPFRVSLYGWGTLMHQDWKGVVRRNRQVKARLDESSYEYKHRSDDSFNLYVRDLDAVQLIVDLADRDILEISGPINESHSDLMIQDLTQSFRNKLFYNRYRYKVSCKMYRYEGNMDVFEDIVEFVTSSLDPKTYYLNNTLRQYPRWKAFEAELSKTPLNGWSRYRYIPYSATGTVYLMDYDDVCTMHLMFKNEITSTTKVVLIEELE